MSTLNISRDFQVEVSNYTKWDRALEAQITARMKEVMHEISTAFALINSTPVFNNTVKLRGEKTHQIKAALNVGEVVALGKYFASLNADGLLDNTGKDCLELLRYAWVLMTRSTEVKGQIEWMGEQGQIVYACLVI